VYSAKLPTKGWINLAQVRQIEADDDYLTVVITWSNGEKQVFKHDDAKAVIDAWIEASLISQCRVANFRQLSKRKVKQ
jgi:hypothetical protein